MLITKNTSGYETRGLKTVIVQAHDLIKAAEGRDAPNWKTLRVVVRGRSGSHVSGRAYYWGNGREWDVCLTVPRNGLSARVLLDLAYHELMHTYGYKHSQYGGHVTQADAERLIPTDYTIPKPGPRTKPARDVKSERIESLLSRRASWESRLKRAQTALRKVNKSLRYYERSQPELFAAMSGKPKSNAR